MYGKTRIDRRKKVGYGGIMMPTTLPNLEEMYQIITARTNKPVDVIEQEVTAFSMQFAEFMRKWKPLMTYRYMIDVLHISPTDLAPKAKRMSLTETISNVGVYDGTEISGYLVHNSEFKAGKIEKAYDYALCDKSGCINGTAMFDSETSKWLEANPMVGEYLSITNFKIDEYHERRKIRFNDNTIIKKPSPEYSFESIHTAIDKLDPAKKQVLAVMIREIQEKVYTGCQKCYKSIKSEVGLEFDCPKCGTVSVANITWMKAKATDGYNDITLSFSPWFKTKVTGLANRFVVVFGSLNATYGEFSVDSILMDIDNSAPNVETQKQIDDEITTLLTNSMVASKERIIDSVRKRFNIQKSTVEASITKLEEQRKIVKDGSGMYRVV